MRNRKLYLRVVVFGLCFMAIGLSSIFRAAQVTIVYETADAHTEDDETFANLEMNESLESQDCQTYTSVSGLSSMPSPKFLINYKNPCWFENISKGDLYDENSFRGKEPKELFSSLKDYWTNVLLKERVRHRRLRCLPYFFLVGMPKCGSTDLYENIILHPDITAPPIKEPHWWSRVRFGYGDGKMVPIEDYIDLFDLSAIVIKDKKENSEEFKENGYHPMVTVDASASTVWFNDNWWKMRENCGQTEPVFTNPHYIKYILPSAKAIVILRNPTQRLYSSFLYFDGGNVTRTADTFHKIVEDAIATFHDCFTRHPIRTCVFSKKIASKAKISLRVGLYYIFIKEWLKVFPRQNIIIVRLEDYAERKLETLKEIFDFLGLRKMSTEEEIFTFKNLTRIANARKVKYRTVKDMRVDTRQLLDEFYAPFNQQLAMLLRDPKYLWKFPLSEQ